MDDERLAELLPRATRWLEASCDIQLSNSRSNSSYKLDMEDVDKVNMMFPLCMRQLHRMLRQRHRLGHTARVSVAQKFGRFDDSQPIHWSFIYNFYPS